jgi:hypothetical protein
MSHISEQNILRILMEQEIEFHTPFLVFSMLKSRVLTPMCPLAGKLHGLE